MQVRQFESQVLQTLVILFKNYPVEQLTQFVEFVMQVTQFELQILQTLVVAFKNVPLLQKHIPD